MTTILTKAIEQYSKNDGVIHVKDPKPGQRVVVLARQPSRHLVPTIATVRRVNEATGKVLVDLYTDKSVRHHASKENIWTQQNPAPHSWEATKDGEAVMFPVCSGTHHCWIGEVLVGVDTYERRYTETDYDTGELTREQIAADWFAQPETFTKKDPRPDPAKRSV